MRILITNDDGIHSPVLPRLVSWARQRFGAEVTVVAPKFEQSGKSNSIDFSRRIQVKKYDLDAECEAWAMDSTPADCVKFAILGLKKTYDLILSGINKGYNLGNDISYSGTVGAIMEAARMEHKAVALSTDVDTFETALNELDHVFDFVEREKLFLYTQMLNINFPSEGSRGIRITRHGGLFYTDEFVCQGNDTYIHVGDPIREGEDLTVDIHAVVNGYISITPLTAEKTDLLAFERFKETTKSF